MTELHWTRTIHHDPSPRYVDCHETIIGGTATVRLRAALAAPITQIYIRTCPDGEQSLTPMHRLVDDSVAQWWEGELSLTMPRTGYRFLLITDEGSWWLNAAGVFRHTPTDACDFKILAGYHAPRWLRDTVFYQIFPDRFADGDPSNNVRTAEYLCYGRPVVARSWGEQPSKEYGSSEFFGGDLQGVVEKLSYLEALGINAIYLNPIFTAPSNHKYDVADYEEVDPHLGGNQALVTLRRALDERGMKLVLDVVPNHCGSTHRWFREAQADPTAPTAEFFTFRRHPDQYDSWLGVRTLPKLNYRSERLRDVMYAGPDAVMRKWLRPPFRIDGWRIDVANMLARQGESQLGHKIGRGIRRAVKAENPDAYLLGEHFFDGTPHLQGEELDASMNYQGFSIPLRQWLDGYEMGAFSGEKIQMGTLPTEALAEQWLAFLAVIPWQIALQQFNLLGSHDTTRILTALGENRDLARVAAVLLFTFPGIPCIYYGDEIGLSGGADPDCRRCMPWDPTQWDQELHECYRTLAWLRRSSPALGWGGFQLLHAAGETIAFMREVPEERLIVVARRSDDGLAALPVCHAGIPDGTRLRELFSGVEVVVEGGRFQLAGLPPVGAQVWVEGSLYNVHKNLSQRL